MRCGEPTARRQPTPDPSQIYKELASELALDQSFSRDQLAVWDPTPRPPRPTKTSVEGVHHRRFGAIRSPPKGLQQKGVLDAARAHLHVARLGCRLTARFSTRLDASTGPPHVIRQPATFSLPAATRAMIMDACYTLKRQDDRASRSAEEPPVIKESNGIESAMASAAAERAKPGRPASGARSANTAWRIASWSRSHPSDGVQASDSPARDSLWV